LWSGGIEKNGLPLSFASLIASSTSSVRRFRCVVALRHRALERERRNAAAGEEGAAVVLHRQRELQRLLADRDRAQHVDHVGRQHERHVDDVGRAEGLARERLAGVAGDRVGLAAELIHRHPHRGHVHRPQLVGLAVQPEDREQAAAVMEYVLPEEDPGGVARPFRVGRVADQHLEPAADLLRSCFRFAECFEGRCCQRPRKEVDSPQTPGRAARFARHRRQPHAVLAEECEQLLARRILRDLDRSLLLAWAADVEAEQPHAATSLKSGSSQGEAAIGSSSPFIATPSALISATGLSIFASSRGLLG
jgi:hypothetical protein